MFVCAWVFLVFKAHRYTRTRAYTRTFSPRHTRTHGWALAQLSVPINVRIYTNEKARPVMNATHTHIHTLTITLNLAYSVRACVCGMCVAPECAYVSECAPLVIATQKRGMIIAVLSIALKPTPNAEHASSHTHTRSRTRTHLTQPQTDRHSVDRLPATGRTN